MDFYPINLNIKGRLCLVVGGGKVGERKIKTLLQCKAKVVAVSPFFTDEILDIKNPDLVLYTREFENKDLNDIFIVITATSNRKLNNRIANEAIKKNILCNITDNPKKCSFTLPSVIQRGDLMVTVSTGGKSPLISRRIRKELSESFGREYADVLKAMGKIREETLKSSDNSDMNREKFRKIVEGGIIELAREKRYEDIDKLLLDILGEGFIFKDLLK